MPDFKDMKSLMKYIESTLPINLQIIGEEVKNILKDNVEELWYNRPFVPSYYTRTMEYIESIQCSKAKKIDGGYEVVVYFATDLILPYPAENGEWSKHESIVDGGDVSVAIPYYIEYGNNSPIFEYEGVRPVGTTKEWLNATGFINKRMNQLLKNHGFIISIK